MVGDAAQEDEDMEHFEQEVVTEQEAAELLAAEEGTGDVNEKPKGIFGSKT